MTLGTWIIDKWNCDLDEVKMNVEVLLSQILGKRFSKFSNRSQTHDLPEYQLGRSHLSTVVVVFIK